MNKNSLVKEAYKKAFRLIRKAEWIQANLDGIHEFSQHSDLSRIHDQLMDIHEFCNQAHSAAFQSAGDSRMNDDYHSAFSFFTGLIDHDSQFDGLIAVKAGIMYIWLDYNEFYFVSRYQAVKKAIKFGYHESRLKSLTGYYQPQGFKRMLEFRRNHSGASFWRINKNHANNCIQNGIEASLADCKPVN